MSSENKKSIPKEQPQDSIKRRYDHFYGALYNYILNFFSIGYAEDSESGTFLVNYSVENNRLSIHFKLKPTIGSPLEKLRERIDSFFYDMGMISEKLYLDEIEGIRMPSSKHPPFEYVLKSVNMQQLIQLFKELEKFYKAENLDVFLRKKASLKRKVSLEDQVAMFQKKANLPDETIADTTCQRIDFFPPVTAISREHAYVIFNRSSWKENLIPDSLERVCLLLDFAKGKTSEVNGLHLTH